MCLGQAQTLKEVREASGLDATPVKDSPAKVIEAKKAKPDRVASRPSDTAEVSQTEVRPPDLGAILAKAEDGAAHLAPALTKRGTLRKRAPKGSIDKRERERLKSQKRRDKLKAQKESVK